MSRWVSLHLSFTSLPSLTSLSTLVEDIVNIYVGPPREHFEVHEESLYQDVPVYDTMFKSGFMEGLKKSTDLPEDEPETFETFIQWLYDDGLDDIEIDRESQWSEPLLGRMKLVLFASKYWIDVLADYAMATILLATQEWEERDFTQPSLKVIELVHDNTYPTRDTYYTRPNAQQSAIHVANGALRRRRYTTT